MHIWQTQHSNAHHASQRSQIKYNVGTFRFRRRKNGHLGLVVSPATYQTLVPDGVPYRQPVNPGRFVIEGRETQHQITQRRAEHAETIQLFKEVIDVERSIIQQIVSAIEPKYLKALRLPTTNRLIVSIPAIFTHLFTNYGDIYRGSSSDTTANKINPYYLIG